MHHSVMKYIEGQAATLRMHAASGRVLDAGALDVNGTNRPYFTAATLYVGVDAQWGKGVDVQANCHDLPFPADTFDVAVSTEMLEHDSLPHRTVAELYRVLRPRGTLLLTARGYDETGCFSVHEFPGDYWRFSPGGMRALLADAGFAVIASRPDTDRTAPGVFARAIKLPPPRTTGTAS